MPKPQPPRHTPNCLRQSAVLAPLKAGGRDSSAQKRIEHEPPSSATEGAAEEFPARCIRARPGDQLPRSYEEILTLIRGSVPLLAADGIKVSLQTRRCGSIS